LEKSVETLKTDLDLKSKHCSQSDTNIHLLEETIENLKNDMSNVQKELAKQTRQRDEGKVNIKKLEKSVETLKTDLDLKSEQCSQSDANGNRLEETIENLKNDMSNLQKTLETSQEETRQQLNTKETETEKFKKKVQDVTKEKDSKIAKIKLLLGNQKKLESQLKKCAGDFEEMVTINEDLKKRLTDRDALEVEVQNQQKQIDELKIEREENNGPMPWELDPELQDMTPTELKSILGDDLTPKEKSRLNEMCVQELEKELSAKISAENSHIWQISSLTKELEKNRIKLNHLQDNQSTRGVKVASATHDEKSKVEPKPTRGIKRRSFNKENEGCQNTTPVLTSRSVKKDAIADEASEAVSASAAKKPRRSTRDVTTTAPADKMKNGQEQENDVKLTMARSKKSAGARLSLLDKGMMDNPFTKKMTRSSTSSKRPLETITNKS